MYKSGVHWYVTVTWTPLYSGSLAGGCGRKLEENCCSRPRGPVPLTAVPIGPIGQVTQVETDRHRQDGIIVDIVLPWRDSPYTAYCSPWTEA